MDIAILSEDKGELRLEFSEIDHGQLNLIKDALWEDSAVEMAGFQIDHPEVGKPVFVLKTKGKPAKKVWNTAVEKLMKQFESMKKEFRSLNR